ncbi:MAG: methyltransferase [Alphaproteobacteria bacterium]|nr:methyltransferase [Alphaproteobacteria bacterium]
MVKNTKQEEKDQENLNYDDWDENNSWNVSTIISLSTLTFFENALAEISHATMAEEIQKGENKGLWKLDAICNPKPDEKIISNAFKAAAEASGQDKVPEYKIEYIEPKNWLLECAANFPPINIGSYYIHGSHITDDAPKDKIEIELDAATAFGSGEHFTTKGCLMAIEDFSKGNFKNQRILEKIKKKTSPLKALDMGCGSGILAMAIAKIMPNSCTIAIDNDDEATRVTTYNISKNHETDKIISATADGYNSSLVNNNAPFDLIVANILAKPLISMAPDMFKNLAVDGIAIISGLLTEQEEMVMDAHNNCGFELIKSYRPDEWSTLVLCKK